jgi:hypothetical protein
MSGEKVLLCCVAQALVPAASALMPTLEFDTMSQPRTGVETSLDTAGRSACATSAVPGGVAGRADSGPA